MSESFRAAIPGTLFSIVEVSGQEIVQQIGMLRGEVWKDKLNPAVVHNGAWLDAYDKRAIHLAAMSEDGEIVGAARLTVHECLEDVPEWEDIRAINVSVVPPISWVGRLVVKESARGPRIAKDFDRALLAIARRCETTGMYGVANAAQKRSLTQLGFKNLGKSPIAADERYAKGSARVDVYFMCLQFDNIL